MWFGAYVCDNDGIPDVIGTHVLWWSWQLDMIGGSRVWWCQLDVLGARVCGCGSWMCLMPEVCGHDNWMSLVPTSLVVPV